jgi:pimeloyl-ACP methyl ester carboxylesterase
MPTEQFTLPDGTVLSYTDIGNGRPIVLLHGVCMSRIFFERNVDALADRHRVIAVDFRSHGDSPRGEGGHTVAQYARDVRALMEHLDLTGVTLAGWSMGSLVIWDYQRQFGPERLAGVVVISQGPSDLTQPGWPNGIADLEELHGFVSAAQADFRGFFAGFVPEMMAEKPSDQDRDRFVDAVCKVGANAGALILLDQTLQDYRADLPGFTVPHLLIWGRDEKIIKLASGEWLRAHLPDAEYVVFEHSGHCPMWEEPDRFNMLLADWVGRHEDPAA